MCKRLEVASLKWVVVPFFDIMQQRKLIVVRACRVERKPTFQEQVTQACE
jgi:hypothetical protein